MWKRVCAWLMILLITGLFALLPASFAADTTVEPFTLSFEFYDSFDLPESAPPGDAKPLNPLQLSKDQFITVAIRYSGLQQDGGLANDGFRCLAAALCYDASCFELQGFEEPEDGGPAVEWNDAEWSSANWVADAQYGYTISASVQTIKTEESAAEGETPGAAGEPSEERDIRRIYIQYIAEEYRDSWDILTDDSGYLGAFNFRVLKEIPENAGVKFTWDNLAVGLYEIGSLDSSISLRLADAATTDHFEAPKDVHVATSDGGDDPDPEGYTITGTVTSYNAANPITYYLCPWDEAAGNYVTVPKDPTKEDLDHVGVLSGLLDLEVLDSPLYQKTQTFTIPDVPAGHYQLRLVKSGHLSFIVNYLVIDANELTDGVYQLEKHLGSQKISMISGDVNENGNIDTGDASSAWGLIGRADSRGDANGNGVVDTGDVSAIWAVMGRSVTGDCTITLQK